MQTSRSSSPGFSVIFPGKKKKKRKSVKKQTLSASYVHPSKRTIVTNTNAISQSQQRVIRRPQAGRPALNQTFQTNEKDIQESRHMNFPEGREPKRAPKRRTPSPKRDEPVSFLNADRYREDYRSVSRSMVRDDQYSASSSAYRDEHTHSHKPKRLSESENSSNSFQADPNVSNSVYVVVSSAEPPPPKSKERRRDPSLIFGPNPSVTRDFQDDYEALQEESEEDDNYSSILREMGRLEDDKGSGERASYSPSASSSDEEKEEELDNRKNPLLMGELRLALAGLKKGKGDESENEKKKKKKKKSKKKKKESVQEPTYDQELDGPDLLHDLSESSAQEPQLSLEERFRISALQLNDPDESDEEDKSLGPVFLEDDPIEKKKETQQIDLSIEEKFKALNAMSSESNLREEADRSKSQVTDLEAENELLRTQLQLSKEKLRDTMTKSVNRTEKLMLQISKCRGENETLKREIFDLRQRAVVTEHQNLTSHENLHENQLAQLDKLLEENARLREKNALDVQDLQMRLGEAKRQLDQALTDVLESKRANSSLQGELEHYMKRGKELTKQLTHVKAELETSRSSQIRVKQEFDETILETSGDVRSMRDRISMLEAQAKVDAEEKQRILSEVQSYRLKLDEANSKLVDQTFKNSSRTSELNKKLSEKEQRIKELSSKPQGFQQEMSQWQSRCRMLVDQNESMQDDMIEANAKVEGLGNRLALQQEELSSLKAEIRDGKEREARLAEKAQRAEANVLSLEGDLQKSKDQLHRQERQIKDHSEHVQKLTKRIQELQNENDEGLAKRKKISEDLRTQVQKLKEAINTKNQERKEVESRFESRLGTLKSEINALSAENDSLQRELMDDSNAKRQEELQNQLNEMREQIAAVNSQLVDQTFKHSQRISELNKRVAEKEQTIQNLRDQLQRKEETT